MADPRGKEAVEILVHRFVYDRLIHDATPWWFERLPLAVKLDMSRRIIDVAEPHATSHQEVHAAREYLLRKEASDDAVTG